MEKTTSSVTIDGNLKALAKKNNINISLTLQEALKAKLSLIGSDIKAIDKQILLSDIKELESEISLKSVNLTDLREKLQQIEETSKQAEKEALIKEKEALDKETLCYNCGLPHKKMHTFKVGKICNTCFLSAEGGEVEKWEKMKQ